MLRHATPRFAYASRMRPTVPLLALAVLLPTTACAGKTEAPSRLTGPIVTIDAEGEVLRGFTIEADGEEWEILADPEIDYGVDVAHLELHREDKLPVAVQLEERGGDLYALSIEDL